MKPEAARQLALNLAILEGLLNEKLSGLLKEYDEKLGVIREEVGSISIPEFVLPDDVAFDANVQEALEKARYEIGEQGKKLTGNIGEVVSTLSKLRVAFEQHNHDDAYSKLGHEHPEYAFVSEVEKQFNALSASIASKFSEHQTKVASIHDILDKSSKSGKAALSKLEKLTREEVNNLGSRLDAELETLSNSIKLIHKKLDGDISKALLELQEFKNQTTVELEGKSDSDHHHDGVYSKEGHEHPELAERDHTHKEFKTFAPKVHNHDANYSKLGHEHAEYALEKVVDAAITAIKKDLKKKIDEGTFNAFKDQFPNKESLIQQIKKEIPKPQDGKDGLNWEFKFHATKKGVLLYKREDEDTWKSYDLLVKVKTVEFPGAPIGGGGFAIGTPQNYLVVTDNVTTVLEVNQLEFIGATVSQPTPNKAVVTINASGEGSNVTGYGPGGSLANFKVWMGSALTDANGEFSVDLTPAGFTNVLSYNISAHIDNSAGLQFEERHVSCNVITVTPTELSGVSFVQRELVRLLGTKSFAMMKAPQDITISITVHGI